MEFDEDFYDCNELYEREEEGIWDTDTLIRDMLFETNYSKKEIGWRIDRSEAYVSQRIKELGLDWVKRSGENRRKVSRGQLALTNVLKKLIPGAEILNEEPIGERLRLDIYCPKFKLAIEYHGRQHFHFVEHFHKDYSGFVDSQRRDERKLEICRDLGIAIVVFRYNDDLSEEAVFERIMAALTATPYKQEKKKPSQTKGNPYYESYKQRQREYRRLAYQRMKKARGRR